ncbi:alpha/beta fold hydrolase [Paracoccus sp. MC1854]|uniref:alpha/beta fold hydrolase n=1 Tax=Paracoccus sp. MC1854 TaxID=2760306 RepID=UPI00351C67E6
MSPLYGARYKSACGPAAWQRQHDLGLRATSGIIELAARKHRVIVLDRPGYGHSERPRNRIRTAEAQADLIHDAPAQLGIEHATVLGHSWRLPGRVALALKYPDLVGGLVLASGCYWLCVAAPAVGDVIRHTISRSRAD